MAEQKAEGGGSFPLNLNTLLALLTLVGVLLVSQQKLTSTRPIASAGGEREFMGEQRVEARLWEDPFKIPERGGGGPQPKTDPTTLLDQIRKRAQVNPNVRILPVMIPGGSYSEDQESRIRSRFAIVSALGQLGYVPSDVEHISSVKLSWPDDDDLKKLNLDAKDHPEKSLAELWLWLQDKKKDKKTSSVNETSTPLDLRYEWYRPKTFSRYTKDPNSPDVLVLWLNERHFDSEPSSGLPLLRLSWLLAPIMEAVPKSDARPEGLPVALIGPWLSSTLRAMLPDWKPQGEIRLQQQYSLWPKITKVLTQVEVYSATASAMDAVLVRTSPGAPRAGVHDALVQKIGFKDFHNFVATDDQLASEMLDELCLRGVDLSKKENHLVLLSEWDNFYTRMLVHTYAAELKWRQHAAELKWRQPDVTIQDKFIYIRNYLVTLHQPLNLESFIYLRGLDGQTVGNESGSPRGSGREEPSQASPTSAEDLRKWLPDANKWTPDANKAEGRAQFDYLSRLGEQLVVLEERLSKDDEHIKAIGIVGSDVYDTLLILQALRHRFPNVLFFTTGLDARFWHPRELSWSRNLLVTSGYGLTLDPDLQKSVPFFRDSSQTAQFTAALAALGHKELLRLQYIPPRRFEIGKRGAVDLSVVPSAKSRDFENLLPLHPSPPRSITPRTYTDIGIGIVILTAGLGLLCFCGPLRRLTWEASRFQIEALRYQEEDVGGIKGAWTLVKQLQKPAQEQKAGAGQWLAGEFNKVILSTPCGWLPADATLHEDKSGGGSPTDTPGVLSAKMVGAKLLLDKEKATEEVPLESAHCQEEVLQVVLDFLNRLFHRKTCCPGEAVQQTGLLSKKRKSPLQLRERRVILDRAILDALVQTFVDEPRKSGASVEQDPLEKDILRKAKGARKASRQLSVLRHRWVCQFRIVAAAIVAVAIGLGVQIVRDTFLKDNGEPFSLTTGTSAWPGEIFRFAAFALAISFIFQSYHSLGITMFQLTRRFRLPLAGYPSSHESFDQKSKSLRAKLVGLWQRCQHWWATMRHWFSGPCGLPAPPKPGATVSASTLWKVYQQYGIFPYRVRRILCLFLLYMVFALGIGLLNQSDIQSPLRGDAVRIWDKVLLGGALLSFFFLTFMLIDTARLCRWFIHHLSKAPTDYPLATIDHFSRLRGDVDKRYLDEWIDLQLIADLTERVGRLVYCPFIVFFLLLLARNEWWDRWPWPWSLITIFVCNLMLAAASVIILQNAARQAKNEAVATLAAKVKRLQAATAESEIKNNANQAEKLLEEIRTLQRGAFVPFWENPVLRAILLPSSGVAVLQMLVWLMGS
jgi:hypothetical protein